MEPDTLATHPEAPAPPQAEPSPTGSQDSSRAPGRPEGAAVHSIGHGIGNGDGNGNGDANVHAVHLSTYGHTRNGAHASTSWAGTGHSEAAHVHAVEHWALGEARLDSLYLRFGKRFIDVVGGAAGLVLGSPLLLLAAILIKIESRGPIFYRSTRIGRGGRPFTFLKLRSMFNGADRQRGDLHHLNECDGPVFKMRRDPRVTRIGRFLRITSLDEIPQFYNVLCGEMSLVGPRPPIPEEVAQYESWQLHRLDVRPGITCLWQISGRSQIGFKEWMRLDLEYIRHQSFGLDMRILVKTIPAVLSREGAY